MPIFIINKNAQSNGDHEVHNITTGCRYMPAVSSQIDLGHHASCHAAVAEAKRRWPQSRINGCYYCASACHSS
jgi:hypothetical protein